MTCRWCGRDNCVMPNAKSLTFRCVDMTHAREEGKQEERAKIVAWLRTDFAMNKNAREFADAIERGEYEVRT